MKLLTWVANHALPSGVLAEQVHPLSGEPLSVSPLTWSHATFVATTQRILTRLGAMKVCPECGLFVMPNLRRENWMERLFGETREFLMELCGRHKVVLVASFPSLNKVQADSQRGKGNWQKNVAALRQLNAMGYGEAGSGLELDLVSNPVGAFLSASQEQTEKKFRQDLKARWAIVFNHLYAFSNVPLGRFRKWLIRSGNHETYMRRLAERFNPSTLPDPMCRTLVSVSWDGYLHDCDFNLAAGLLMGGRPMHVSELAGPPAPGTPIAVGDHCYGCTAGSGFT